MPRLLLWVLISLAGGRLLGAATATNTPAADPAGTGRPLPSVPAEVFPLRRFEWIRPFTNVALVPVVFPDSDPAAAVEALTVTPGTVWALARPRLATNTSPGTGRLWAGRLQDGRLLPIRGLIEQHVANALASRPDGVWLGLDGGVAALDPQTLVVDPFSAPQGLTAARVVGFAEAGGRLHTLAETGVLFSLNRDGRAWQRQPGLPGGNPRLPITWRFLAGSGDWLLALAPGEMHLRHHAAPSWAPVGDDPFRQLPAAEPPPVHAALGDGDGAFWIGSDLGLHRLIAETGTLEHRLAPATVTVAGASAVPPGGPRPSAAALRQAHSRLVEGIRTRMRDRARLARVAAERGRTLDPVTPQSRLPGGVRALARDGQRLWVATTDGPHTQRGRVLLYDPLQHAWLGWFPIGLPVRALAADADHLWLGLDTGDSGRGNPLVLVHKRALLASASGIPAPEPIPPAELGSRLASLPVVERAVLAFFAGDTPKVVELLGPREETAGPEELFLLAFAHDAAGLGQPERLHALLARLHERHPDSPQAEATRHLRPTPAPATAAGLPPAVQDILRRRDLDGDGRINMIEFRLWQGPGVDLPAADRNQDAILDPPELIEFLRQPK